jgi:hypothetical protein
VYRSPMPSRRGTSGGLRERERQIASAVAVVAVVAVAAVVFVVVVLTDASPPHPRRWSTSCQARGGDVAPAAAVRPPPPPPPPPPRCVVGAF